ncbi:MAG: HAD hydrolase-like protein [Gemmatimonadaceae bacterium]|nr:HAD hydrolase-like protein [Gemmatimonadaceae bacterium]
MTALLPSDSPADLPTDRGVVLPEAIGFRELVDRYEAVLFDAYGVLVNASGALPGAAQAVAHMNARGQPFLIVTNDASRSPERVCARFARLGIMIRPEHVMSSGMLIGPALVEHGLGNARVTVLGTPDSADYARAVGAEVVEPSVRNPADAVVIADEGGFDTLNDLDSLLNMVLAACRAGRPPRLLLANPDLVYPAGPGTFGLTAGALALLIERALGLLLHEDAPRFELLGKPAARHFETALAGVNTRDAVMLGDTLHTDIEGANGVGIASALLLTGVTLEQQVADAVRRGHAEHVPRYVLRDLLG